MLTICKTTEESHLSTVMNPLTASTGTSNNTSSIIMRVAKTGFTVPCATAGNNFTITPQSTEPRNVNKQNASVDNVPIIILKMKEGLLITTSVSNILSLSQGTELSMESLKTIPKRLVLNRILTSKA